jgi:hypothetical protein
MSDACLMYPVLTFRWLIHECSSTNSLKISKRSSKAINLRTYNTMTKRKNDKRTNNDLQKTLKTKDHATRTPLKPGMNSCAFDGKVVPAPRAPPIVLSHEWGKDWIVNMTNGTYPWSFLTQMWRCTLFPIIFKRPFPS